MKNNRIGFISLIIMLLLMFFFFGRPFLMYAVIVFLVLAAVDCITMIIDSRRINAVLSVNEVGQHGKTITYTLDVGKPQGDSYVQKCNCGAGDLQQNVWKYLQQNSDV